MSLEEFIAQVKKETAKFEAFWLASRAENPEQHWPLVMGEPEWYEQFVIYVQGTR
jgi:hypothetical protein